MDSLTELERAFKKLKASVYYEKTSVVLCEKLAEYEASPDFESKLNEIVFKLNSHNEEKWSKYVDSLLSEIDLFAFPKKMEDSLEEDQNQKGSNPVYIYNYPTVSPAVKECQFFIDMPVEAYLLGILWVMKIGVCIDEKLSDEVYGNRVRRAKNGISRADDETPYLFKPYFGQYRSWRDRAVAVAERAIKEDKQSVCMISLDFKSFFYQVRFTREEWNDAFFSVDKEISESRECKRLHEFCFSVFERYANVLRSKTPKEEYQGASSILPIGFAPSLIASNWCLHKFDEGVLRQIDPLYYGRYVDDILIVKRYYGGKDQFTPENLLKNLLVDQEPHTETRAAVEASNELAVSEAFLEAKESRIIFQQNKTKLFFFDAQAPQALLLGLKEEIRKNSSEFRLMPDIFGMSIEDSYASIFDYQFNGSPNKIRDIENATLNKYELSKYLGCLQKVLPTLEDRHKTTLLTDLVNLFDKSSLIDCCIYWERIIEILICASVPNLLDKFIDNIEGAIKETRFLEDSKVSESSVESKEKFFRKEDPNMSALIRVALGRLLKSAASRASALIRDDAIDAVIMKLYSKPLSFFSNFFSESSLLSLSDDIEDVSARYNSAKCAFWKTYLLNASAIPIVPVFVQGYCAFSENGQTINFSRLEDIMRLLPKVETELGNTKLLLPYVVKTQDIEYSIYIQKIACGKEVNNAFAIHDEAKTVYRLLNLLDTDDSETCSVRDIDTSGEDGQSQKKQKPNSIDGNYCINVASNKHLDFGRMRVAVANMQLNEEDISFVLKKKQKTSYSRYKDLRRLTTDAKKCGANLLVLPEASVPLVLLPFLIKFSEKENIAVVCGIEHVLGGIDEKRVYNLTATILPYRDKKDEWEFAKLTLHQKVHFSPHEKQSIVDHGYACAEGSTFELYGWRNVWFPVYCCYELTSIQLRALFQCYADLIIVPIWNRDIKYYEHIEYSLSRDLTCFCVQANNAKYGDSCIIQPKNRLKATLLRVKGGINTTVLAADLDIKGLRDAQMTESGEGFKPTSPDFNFDIAKMKNNGSLFSFICNDTTSTSFAPE